MNINRPMIGQRSSGGPIAGVLLGIVCFWATSYVSSMWMGTTEIWRLEERPAAQITLVVVLVLLGVSMAAIIKFLPGLRLSFAASLAVLLLIGVVLAIATKEVPLGLGTTYPLDVEYFLRNAGRNAVAIALLSATIANALFSSIANTSKIGTSA